MKRILFFLFVLHCTGLSQQWSYLGLGAESIQTIAVDWSNPEILYAGSTGGIFKSTNAGASWDTLKSGIYVRTVVIHPKMPNILYATCSGAPRPVVYKTTDAGQSWWEADSGLTDSSLPPSDPGPLAIDPEHPDTLYAGTAGDGPCGLYRSTDGAQTWARLPDSAGLGFGNGVTAVAVDPRQPTTIYAGINGTGDLLRSTDAGQSWTRVLPGTVAGLTLAIEFHPTLPGTIYLATTGGDSYLCGFFRTTDSGHSWDNPTGGLPETLMVRAVKVLPDSSDPEMYLSGYWKGRGGIFEKPRGGPWQAVSFPHNPGYFNTLACSGGTLYAGGTGVYVRESPTSVTTPLRVAPYGFTLMPTYPNPFNPTTTVQYIVPIRVEMRIILYSSVGQEVAVVYQGLQSPGVHAARIDGTALASGVYYLRLRAPGVSISKSIVLAK